MADNQTTDTAKNTRAVPWPWTYFSRSQKPIAKEQYWILRPLGLSMPLLLLSAGTSFAMSISFPQQMECSVFNWFPHKECLSQYPWWHLWGIKS